MWASFTPGLSQRPAFVAQLGHAESTQAAKGSGLMAMAPVCTFAIIRTPLPQGTPCNCLNNGFWSPAAPGGWVQFITRALARGCRECHQPPAQRRCSPGPGRRTGPRAPALQADVTDAAAVQRLFAQVRERTGQPISAVVNNALAQFRFDGDARPDWRYRQRFCPVAPGRRRPAARSPPRPPCPAHAANKALARIVNVAPTCSRTPWCPTTTTPPPRPRCFVHRTAANDLAGQHGITVNMVSGGLPHHRRASSATPKPCSTSSPVHDPSALRHHPARVCRRRAVLPGAGGDGAKPHRGLRLVMG